MLIDEIVEHCSPTLAGLKTGNIFCMKNEGFDPTREIREMNRILVRRGLRLIPLRRSAVHTLIYLYRPERLRADLVCPVAEEILREKGYPREDPDRCVVELIRRLCLQESFPHEIGLFLGYPASDVRGFMNSPLDGVKCVGCWKVYGNQEEAERTFARYKKCTAIYRNQRKRGKSLEYLIA